MHVALFTPGWPLGRYHNGIVTYVHWMRRELESLGHRVSVFSRTDDPSTVDPHLHVVRRGVAGQIVRRVFRHRFPIERDIFEWGRVIGASMLDLHKRDPIDVIEMEESFGWSADVSRITGIPVLVKLHGPAFLSLVEEELGTPMGQERVRREGVALASATAIAAPAESTLSQTLVHYGLDPAIREHVVNPMALVDDGAPRWRLDACDRQTILFVGRFDRRKGGDVVLQAFALLLAQRPALTLVFVGPDDGLLQPDGSRVGFAAFRDSTLPPELRERVEFRGRMQNREIGELRARAMVTMVASRWENQGYTALEAMYQGCPVVCSDVGGNPESVIQGRTGLLARSADAADFAAQIGKLLDDPALAARLGAAARAHVIEHHAAGKVANASLALYQRVISGQR